MLWSVSVEFRQIAVYAHDWSPRGANRDGQSALLALKSPSLVANHQMCLYPSTKSQTKRHLRFDKTSKTNKINLPVATHGMRQHRTEGAGIAPPRGSSSLSQKTVRECNAKYSKHVCVCEYEMGACISRNGNVFFFFFSRLCCGRYYSSVVSDGQKEAIPRYPKFPAL